MFTENEDAIKLVKLLKASEKLNQKKTTVSFNADGTRCSLHLSWNNKEQEDLCRADIGTDAILGVMAFWTMVGVI